MRTDSRSLKILITGGAGFIGSHIARAYLQAGHQVAVIDNLTRGRSEQVPAAVNLYTADICDEVAIREIVKHEQPDIISHHAALVSVRESQLLPEKYTKVNFNGTLNILQIAREGGVKKFIFASSGGAVYGDPPRLPICEDAPRSPLSRYGETKMWAEDILLEEADGLKIVILRYGNVYGPGQDHSVVTEFARALRDRKSLVIFGDGSQSRDYIYIMDVVRANLLALQPNLVGIFNIGSSEGRSVLRVYQSIASRLQSRVPPIHLPDNSYEVRQNILDIQRARTTMEWVPQVKFDEGVKLTIQYVFENP